MICSLTLTSVAFVVQVEIITIISFLLGSLSQKLSGDKSSKSGVTEIRNPKIFNMLPAYEKAQYPYILISDSGLMMHENTLYDMVMCMTDTVGLVHQMPFTCDRKGFAGSVEKVCRLEIRFDLAIKMSTLLVNIYIKIFDMKSK